MSEQKDQFDFTFTERSMSDWTFQEATVWQKIILDPEARNAYREWLSRRDVVVAKSIQICKAEGITDPAEQDRVTMFMLVRLRNDEIDERLAKMMRSPRGYPIQFPTAPTPSR